MSLDVSLHMDGFEPKGQIRNIPIRENGAISWLTREEWDERFPDREPIMLAPDCMPEGIVYSGNITHNLVKMASAAGIYEPLWRPEENRYRHAWQLIAPLEEGLAKLKEWPDTYRVFNPENGWGNYEVFVEFVESYLAACKKYPEAIIESSS
jgi:hypothetical protein